MSTRTIIEINHDCLHELRKNPGQIGDLLLKLGGAYPDQDEMPRGIRFLAQRHHSEAITLKVE